MSHNLKVTVSFGFAEVLEDFAIIIDYYCIKLLIIINYYCTIIINNYLFNYQKVQEVHAQCIVNLPCLTAGRAQDTIKESVIFTFGTQLRASAKTTPLSFTSIFLSNFSQ